jgi:hypothetical protein
LITYFRQLPKSPYHAVCEWLNVCAGCRGDHVLCFPVMHRQRIFGVKKKLLQSQGELACYTLLHLTWCQFMRASSRQRRHTQTLARLRSMCCGAGFLEAALLAIGSRAITGLFRVGRGGPGISSIPAALLSGALTALCMRMGVHLFLLKHSVSATTRRKSQPLFEQFWEAGAC